MQRLIRKARSWLGRLYRSPRSYQKTFQAIYRKAVWTGGDTSIPLSGPGSTLANTEGIRVFIDTELEQFGIASIVDVGCGDLTWVSQTRVPKSNLSYVGVDIVPELIERHGREAKWGRFLQLNAVSDPIPSGDLVIIRDCIIHLRIADVERLLTNLLRSTWKYLLISTYRNPVNDDVLDRWHFHQINLESAPFCLGGWVRAIEEPKFARKLVLFERAVIERRYGSNGQTNRA